MIVDFVNNKHDIQCAIMGRLGLSTKFIKERTGLTPCQVGYRLNKKSIKRADFRNGRDPIVERLLSSNIAREVQQNITR
jgi:hypothetical protein